MKQLPSGNQQRKHFWIFICVIYVALCLGLGIMRQGIFTQGDLFEINTETQVDFITDTLVPVFTFTLLTILVPLATSAVWLWSKNLFFDHTYLGQRKQWTRLQNQIKYENHKRVQEHNTSIDLGVRFRNLIHRIELQLKQVERKEAGILRERDALRQQAGKAETKIRFELQVEKRDIQDWITTTLSHLEKVRFDYLETMHQNGYQSLIRNNVEKQNPKSLLGGKTQEIIQLLNSEEQPSHSINKPQKSLFNQ